jgi:hypothetical protein
MKMICPVCFREISVTVNGKIRRHGFRKDRWSSNSGSKSPHVKQSIRVDGKPCEGSGKIGLTIVQTKPIFNELEKRKY